MASFDQSTLDQSSSYAMRAQNDRASGSGSDPDADDARTCTDRWRRQWMVTMGGEASVAHVQANVLLNRITLHSCPHHTLSDFPAVDPFIPSDLLKRISKSVWAPTIVVVLIVEGATTSCRRVEWPPSDVRASQIQAPIAMQVTIC